MGISDFLRIRSRSDINVSKLLDEDAKEKIANEIKICKKNESNSDKNGDSENDGSDAESACSGGCEAELIEEGERVFSKLKIDYDSPLYSTSKYPKIHFIVPTSQSDWEHDACKEKKLSIQNRIDDWCKEHLEKYAETGEGQSLTCSVTSLPKNIMDIDVMRDTKNDVLLLPFFIWIKDLRLDNVNSTLDEIMPILLKRELSKEELLMKYPNLREAKERAFAFICSHTTRDKRCGVTAPYMRKVFEKELQAHGLYRDNSDFRPGGVNVQYINHVGGHKYAGNLQIYLKDSQTLIWLGRVTPKDIPPLIDHLIIPDKPELPMPEKIRCIKKYHW